MAIPPRNLDAMIEQEDAQRSFQEIKYAEPPAVQDVDQTAMDVAGPVEEPVVRPIEEPIKVAGRIDALTGIMSAIGKRVEKAEKRATPRLDEAEAIEQRGEDIVVRRATPEEEDELATVLGTSKNYTKGLNLPAIAEAAKDIDMAAYLQKIKDDNAELFETVRRGTISYENLLKMAEERGVDNIVRDFIKPGRATPVRAEDILAGLIGAQELSKRTRKLAERAFSIDDPELRQQAFRTAHDAAKMEALLYANISGEVSESARVMFASREAQRVGLRTERGEELEALFEDDSLQDFERFFQAYLAIPEGPGKAKFLQRTWYDKGMDFITESFINSILSSPVTHAVNVAGNAGFMMLRGVEESVAGGIGLLRTSVGGKKDRYYIREGMIQLYAMFGGFVDAALVAGKSFKTGEPLSKGTKIDVRTQRAIGTTDDFGEVLDMYRQGDFGTAFINTFGIYNRMATRFLTSEDEFFKAIQYQAEIKKQAHLRGMAVYDEVLDKGGTMDQARVAMAEEVARIMTNPPKPMRKDASDIAKEATFQSDMGKLGSKLEPIMAHPLAKLFAVPFYRTPTNIMKETFKRSPFAAGHAFYTAMAKGGREADIALARVATGTGVMSMFAYMSMGLDTPNKDVIITGSPLADREAQQARQRLGLQDFSINIRQPDGTYKSYTYSRFDPMSGMLAMAADYAYYAQYEDDPDTLADLAAHAGLAMFNYSLEMPFLQGVSELGGILQGSDNELMAERLSKYFAERATTSVLSTLPTVSSMAAGVERMQDPAVASTMLPAKGIFGEDVTTLSAAFQGFYSALEKARARNPFFNKDLPPKLNLWGETVMAGKGVGYEMISPVRIQDARYQGVDKEFMRLGDGVAMPQKKMGGVLLNRDQYNRYIMLAAKMDNTGKMPGDKGYQEGQTMLDELNDTINRPWYNSIEFDVDKLEELRNIVQSRRTDAREMLLIEYPDLREKIDAARIK